MSEKAKRIVVSACLLGEKCRFDGGSKPSENVLAYCRREGMEVLAVCPERDGGLPVPRTPSEIQGGDGEDVLAGKARIVSIDNEDRTEAFVSGAKRCLERIERFKPDLAILKDGSPSCATRRVYDGTFTKKTREGEGILAVLLRKHGCRAISEKQEPTESP